MVEPDTDTTCPADPRAGSNADAIVLGAFGNGKKLAAGVILVRKLGPIVVGEITFVVWVHTFNTDLLLVDGRAGVECRVIFVGELDRCQAVVIWVCKVHACRRRQFNHNAGTANG